MNRIILTIGAIIFSFSVYAQKKTVLLDVSHEIDTAYTFVNPHMFEQYKDMVEGKIGAHLIINKDREVNETLLAKTDVLIVLSPLNRDRITPKNNLTEVEREAMTNYVRNGGKLIIFMDEEHRVDMESFGSNDLLKSFGMEYGMDLPMKRDIGATSLITNIIKHNYELSYSGSRLLSGGTPISLMNGEDRNVHGAYVRLDNGGTIVAFGETMTGLFMGGVKATLKNGETIIWSGKDDQLFMKDLVDWLLKNE